MMLIVTIAKIGPSFKNYLDRSSRGKCKRVKHDGLIKNLISPPRVAYGSGPTAHRGEDKGPPSNVSIGGEGGALVRHPRGRGDPVEGTGSEGACPHVSQIIFLTVHKFGGIFLICL